MLSSTPAGRPPAIAFQPPPSGPAGASGVGAVVDKDSVPGVAVAVGVGVGVEMGASSGVGVGVGLGVGDSVAVGLGVGVGVGVGLGVGDSVAVGVGVGVKVDVGVGVGVKVGVGVGVGVKVGVWVGVGVKVGVWVGVGVKVGVGVGVGVAVGAGRAIPQVRTSSASTNAGDQFDSGANARSTIRTVNASLARFDQMRGPNSLMSTAMRFPVFRTRLWSSSDNDSLCPPVILRNSNRRPRSWTPASTSTPKNFS